MAARSIRLDQLLVARGLFESREKAQRAILAGDVKIGDRVLDKPGTNVPADAEPSVAAPPKYVSRGGLKLEAALDAFRLDPAGLTCLDIGASTGGFTDCLLQRGAAKVWAVDVGHGQLHWKIRSDPRVVTIEKCNARSLSRAVVPDPIALCVADVSFISLTLILPPALALLTPTGVLVALIKPQFELERGAAGKGGIVRDPDDHQRAIGKIRAFVSSLPGRSFRGVIPSPITGADGNCEFLALVA